MHFGWNHIWIHHNFAKIDDIRKIANIIAILTVTGQRIYCGK
jgi:hypothetical protein